MPSRSESPNILFFMVDQMRPFALPSYGAQNVVAPNIESLVRAGTLFENAYCNYPLCAPSRNSFLTGRLASEIGAFDNAAPLASDQPTFVHYLRREGYYTCLIGKMHFTGPDQLHGYEARRTTDIYPASYSWTADWSKPLEEHSAAGLDAVADAGICRRSMQIDFDEQVASAAVQEIFDIARYRKDAPFFLTVSLSHPHNPYMSTEDFVSLYDPEDFADQPGELQDVGSEDEYTLRLRRAQSRRIAKLSDDQIKLARQCYQAMVTYADDLFGKVMDALRQSGLDHNTLIIFTSDHGDMLGDRGLWFKSCHFEGALRVPLVIAGPGFEAGRRVEQPVSLLDLFPTILKSVDALESKIGWEAYRGRDLRTVGGGDGLGGNEPILAEYTAEHTLVPRVMVRLGRYKYIFANDGEELLYDLKSDPWEKRNIISGASEALVGDFRRIVAETWDLEDLRKRVLLSQERRRTIHEALKHGSNPAWNYQPIVESQDIYVRNDVASVEKRRARL